MPSVTIKAVITLLTGENSFEIQQALDEITTKFQGQVEKIEGSDVAVAQLPDLFMGATLFSETRLVVIKNLAENKAVWEVLTDWIDKVSEDVHIVFVEPKPDKRTRTYKELQKHGVIKEFKLWSDSDTQPAEGWAIDEAQRQGWKLDKKAARLLVERVGVDQWQLQSALAKLSVLETVNEAVIVETIDASSKENVFHLFEAALKGNSTRVSRMIKTLELTEDPYMVFGLLSGQVFQLAVICHSTQPAKEIASAIGAHPFALSKMTSYSATLGPVGAKKLVSIFADADQDLKTSSAEPWLLIERALLKCAQMV